MNDRLTLEELCAEVAAELDRRGLRQAQEDGRVTPAPDLRTVRYYATFGLLDRPVREGREVRYGRRHLLQLLVVKALQARGVPLAEIQAQVYGRSNPELETLLQAEEAARSRAPKAAPPAVVWRELAVEPGLKLMVQEGWAPGMSSDALIDRVRDALAALARGSTSSPLRR
jgi:DNA-binding transcriptional MerR regulator